MKKISKSPIVKGAKEQRNNAGQVKIGTEERKRLERFSRFALMMLMESNAPPYIAKRLLSEFLQSRWC